jgi:hypothetical protein
VPDDLKSWAILVLQLVSQVDYGMTWTPPEEVAQRYPGPPIARKDHHTWTYRKGRLVTGICIPGITLYKPMPSGVAGGGYVLDPATSAPDPQLAVYDTAPTETNWGLVVASGVAIVGVATLFALGIRSAGKRRRRLPSGR